MEKFYTTYAKEINGVTFYFVKKFQTFPEYKNVSPILENYGMHTDFLKACKIAMITEKSIQQQLSGTLENKTVYAKLVKMNHRKVDIYNFKNWHINFPSILKLINLR